MVANCATEQLEGANEFLEKAGDDSDLEEGHMASVSMAKLQVVKHESPASNMRGVRVDLKKLEILFMAMKLGVQETIELLTIGSAADTSITGDGWEVIAVDPIRKANVVGFDSRNAIKRGLAIVSTLR